MIVLNLCCDHEHLFEGWFPSTGAFDRQLADAHVSCPQCGSTRITRRPTAPYVNTGSPAPAPAAPARLQPSPEVLATALTMLRQLARESEDVGKRFADEARRIHYGDSEARNIKGQASRDDVDELMDEGIVVLPVPGDDELH